MTDEEIPQDLHGLIGGYLLDALTDLERQQFERHLASCPDCRAEVAELRESLAEVSRLTATDPPPALRAEVMARARETRPLPPLPSPGSSRVAPDRRDADHPARQRRAGDTPVKRAGWGWRLGAAAAVLAAVTAGGWAITAHREAERAEQRAGVQADQARQETELLTAPDAVVRQVPMRDGTRGSVVVSRSRSQALFLPGSLPAPPPGQAYQLWLMREGTPVPDAWFTAERGRVWVQGEIDDAAALALTLEPVGGSPTPTLPLLAATEL